MRETGVRERPYTCLQERIIKNVILGSNWWLLVHQNMIKVWHQGWDEEEFKFRESIDRLHFRAPLRRRTRPLPASTTFLFKTFPLVQRMREHSSTGETKWYNKHNLLSIAVGRSAAGIKNLEYQGMISFASEWLTHGTRNSSWTHALSAQKVSASEGRVALSKSIWQRFEPTTCFRFNVLNHLVWFGFLTFWNSTNLKLHKLLKKNILNVCIRNRSPQANARAWSTKAAIHLFTRENYKVCRVPPYGTIAQKCSLIAELYAVTTGIRERLYTCLPHRIIKNVIWGPNRWLFVHQNLIKV